MKSGSKSCVKFLRDVPLTGEVVELIIFAVLALCLAVVVSIGPGLAFRRLGARRSWRRNLWVSVAILIVSAAVVLGVRYLLESVWKPFPDKVDIRIYLAAALTIGTIAIGVRQVLWRKRQALKFARTIIAAVVVVALSLTASFAMANVAYHIYPNAYSLLGGGSPTLTKFADLPQGSVDTRPGPVGKWWRGAEEHSNLPAQGKVVSVDVGNASSGFKTTAAEVYLPPAYFANPSPQLPVLVLVAGVPGAPKDWFSVGDIHDALDAWAAEHGGLTPIVAAVDANGSQFHDTLCVDSPEGNAMSYLGKDVPREIIQKFHADPSPERWAIGGLSRGGTCATQMVANYPGRYSTFLNMSGELHPSSGSIEQTIKRYFGGDTRAYEAVSAERILTVNHGTTKFAHVAGTFIAGTKDKEAQVDLQQLGRLAQAAGMNTSYRELEGAHTWQVWRKGFASSLDWLGGRLGLVP